MVKTYRSAGCKRTAVEQPIAPNRRSSRLIGRGHVSWPRSVSPSLFVCTPGPTSWHGHHVSAQSRSDRRGPQHGASSRRVRGTGAALRKTPAAPAAPSIPLVMTDALELDRWGDHAHHVHVVAVERADRAPPPWIFVVFSTGSSPTPPRILRGRGGLLVGHPQGRRSMRALATGWPTEDWVARVRTGTQVWSGSAGRQIHGSARDRFSGALSAGLSQRSDRRPGRRASQHDRALHAFRRSNGCGGGGTPSRDAGAKTENIAGAM